MKREREREGRGGVGKWALERGEGVEERGGKGEGWGREEGGERGGWGKARVGERNGREGCEEVGVGERKEKRGRGGGKGQREEVLPFMYSLRDFDLHLLDKLINVIL